VGAFKETEGTPKSRLIRAAVVNMGLPKGRESYGNGVPVVVSGVTTRSIWRPGKPDHRAKGQCDMRSHVVSERVEGDRGC
jgi:hypothetical protein